MADEAAFLVSEQAAAFGALAGDIFCRGGGHVVVGLSLSDDTATTKVAACVTLNVMLQDAGDGIGAGEHRFAVFPGYRRTADTPQILYYCGSIYSRPQAC